jgi:hypothetical protein
MSIPPERMSMSMYDDDDDDDVNQYRNPRRPGANVVLTGSERREVRRRREVREGKQRWTEAATNPVSRDVPLSNAADIATGLERQQLYATRVTSRGQTKMDTVAMRAILSIGTGNRAIFSIKKLPDEYRKIQPGARVTITSDIASVSALYPDGTSATVLDLNALGARVELCEQLKLGIDYDSPPIFFIITSNIHAIFCTIVDGSIFSLGFGYNGVTQKPLIQKAKDSGIAAVEQVAHMIETLPGALYTADYLLPNIDQQSQISWIGYLTHNITENIIKYLNQAEMVRLDGVVDKGTKIDFSENCIINVNKGYSEASGILHKNTTNCIRWVQEITGIQLSCGVLVKPENCMAVTQEQWNEFKNAYEYNSSTLREVIERIQTSLTPSCCMKGVYAGISTLRNCLPCGGTTKKTRKFAKKYKNRVRKNKTRKNKTRKNKIKRYKK